MNNATQLSLGQTVITPAAANLLTPLQIVSALGRHSRLDWGDVGKEDWSANDKALELGGRLLSVYHTEHGRTFWVITEWDRSVTTVLLPEDY